MRSALSKVSRFDVTLPRSSHYRLDDNHATQLEFPMIYGMIPFLSALYTILDYKMGKRQKCFARPKADGCYYQLFVNCALKRREDICSLTKCLSKEKLRKEVLHFGLFEPVRTSPRGAKKELVEEEEASG